MSSWFSSLKDSATSLAGKVKDSMPVLDNETLQKLTLTTPEMQAARQQLTDEERRRASVLDRLAGMLPWETRDSERDILVDECREAILALSAKKETFTGPWKMPTTGIKAANKKKKDEKEDGDDEEEEPEEEAEDGPSKDSLDKLSKLEPLPSLLGDFDLDSHVGLIQRLLKEDPGLVTMQSTLSGGGERERIFWKNFFFHCAFTRYEAGLSIDEIWSDQPPAPDSLATSVHTEGVTSEAAVEEETITFESGATGKSGTADKTFADPVSDAESATEKSDSQLKVSREASDFEMVDSASDIDGKLQDDDTGDEAVDYELDELEAEIARELEN
jgi:hypothetical protein